MDLQENKNLVFENVKKAARSVNRLDSDINIVAVTKTVDSETAALLIDTGVQHIAENRVDKFLDKYQALHKRPVKWHLIGTLQRRKVKDVINFVDYFHALDSVKLAAEIQKRAEKPINCFLQVNISEEESKHGFKIDEVEDALDQMTAFDKVIITGLMTMAPLDATSEEINAIFNKTNLLRQRLENQKRLHMPLKNLSMGMSNDYQIAIQNGSTFVRIGTSFFK
ncbi:pyridoxal phosphate enzyme, YggS family [Streptococcus urinalis 2285-97]|uniref:Pyridoxal phosphate homeostasis protein n=2 Tax=Streptococcus urinalis TaxID=149016 RepID=G5KD63_9STRE|nr:pyridoxal phosphate enzyme, YggS family [Streptococcus urinalis 2285-97]